MFIDLREDSERKRDGVIPGSVHASYKQIDEHTRSGGLLNVMARQIGKDLLLYCAFGERSALALKAMRQAGIGNCHHMQGGLDAWVKAGGPLKKRADGS
jgi:rhodanese-related sulfurtransferase